MGKSCGRVVYREQELHGDKRRYRIDDLLQMGKEKAWTKQIGYSFLNSCLACFVKLQSEDVIACKLNFGRFSSIHVTNPITCTNGSYHVMYRRNPQKTIIVPQGSKFKS